MEKPHKHWVYAVSRWRRGRDSNPREIALKLISSQPRYDHFDTSAYIRTHFCEMNTYSVFIRIPPRTPVVLTLSHRRKTAPSKTFRRFDFRSAKKISSQPRYDRFDTSLYIQARFCEMNAYSPLLNSCLKQNFHSCLIIIPHIHILCNPFLNIFILLF